VPTDCNHVSEIDVAIRAVGQAPARPKGGKGSEEARELEANLEAKPRDAGE